MNLQFRNKEGFFLMSFKGAMAEPVLRFLLNEKRLTVTIKKFVGEKDSCRVFVNNTDEDISGGNELVEFFIRPGEYVKILAS